MVDEIRWGRALLMAGAWALLMAAIPACVGVPQAAAPLDRAKLNPPVGSRCRIAMLSPVMGHSGREEQTERWIEGTVAEVNEDSILLVSGVQKVRRQTGNDRDNLLTQFASSKDAGWEDLPFEKTRFPKKGITAVQIVAPATADSAAKAAAVAGKGGACACGHSH